MVASRSSPDYGIDAPGVIRNLVVVAAIGLLLGITALSGLWFSSIAIHNLYKSADPAVAISEIARVLEPGGHAVIHDIRHGHEYERVFTQKNCTVEQIGPRLQSLLLAVITMGCLRPATIVARKNPL